VTHLDTSFIVDLLREQARGVDGPATAWLERERDAELAVSVFVRCELEAGAAQATHPAKERAKIRELLASVATAHVGEAFSRTYGETLLGIRRASKSIDTMDLLIATSALEYDAPLLTANARHFGVVPDLTVLTYR